jgi:hypothetical protein
MPEEQAAAKLANAEQKQAQAAQKPQPAKQEQKDEQKKVSDVLQSVNIALDGYDDIFSDFDPSPFERRVLSDDFLNELHKRYVETPKGAFTITFSMPRAFRSEKKEALIKKRIKDYFKDRLRGVEKSSKERLKRGALRVGVGLVLSVSLLMVPEFEQAFIAALVSPLLWYLMWSGFESVFEASGRMRKRKAFLERFLRAEYTFKDQEGVVGEVLSSSSYR